MELVGFTTRVVEFVPPDETRSDVLARVAPPVGETESVTVPAKPFTDETVIVEDEEPPDATVREDGLAEIAKSGVGTGERYGIRLFDCALPRPVTAS